MIELIYGMAKSLAQDRASSSGIWPYHNNINECDNPIIIYLVPHFRDVSDNFRCYIRNDKALEGCIYAVVHCNHAHSYSIGTRAFVVLACLWITTI